jgi:hypothetical protein
METDRNRSHGHGQPGTSNRDNNKRSRLGLLVPCMSMGLSSRDDGDAADAAAGAGHAADDDDDRHDDDDDDDDGRDDGGCCDDGGSTVWDDDMALLGTQTYDQLAPTPARVPMQPSSSPSLTPSPGPGPGVREGGQEGPGAVPGVLAAHPGLPRELDGVYPPLTKAGKKPQSGALTGAGDVAHLTPVQLGALLMRAIAAWGACTAPSRTQVEAAMGGARPRGWAQMVAFLSSTYGITRDEAADAMHVMAPPVWLGRSRGEDEDEREAGAPAGRPEDHARSNIPAVAEPPPEWADSPCMLCLPPEAKERPTCRQAPRQRRRRGTAAAATAAATR